MQGLPFPIITYQVITGNYSRVLRLPFYRLHYNIPSNNRELQHGAMIIEDLEIITYQVITGNYSNLQNGA